MGRCPSYGTGITFWPLVEIVEELGGVDALAGLLADADDGSTIVEHIRAATGTAATTAPRATTAFGPSAGSSSTWPRAARSSSASTTCTGRSRPCSI